MYTEWQIIIITWLCYKVKIVISGQHKHLRRQKQSREEHKIL